MDFLGEQIEEREIASNSTKEKEAGLRKNHKDLCMDEILYLLRSKVQPGHQLPSNLKDPPWQIRHNNRDKTNNNEEITKINLVLHKSWEAQSSTIPQCDGHGDFSDFIVSNSSLAVSALLKSYFKTLGIDTALIFGVTLWGKDSQNDIEDYDGTPHVWLDINGNDIDNSYVDVPSSGQVTIDFVYNLRKRNKYVRENPWKTKHKLYLGQESDSTQVSQTVHNLKVFREYHTEENNEKYLVFSLHHAELNPTVKMYDIIMRHFLETEFNAKPENLVTKWKLKCWCCGAQKPKEELKSCTTCKIGVYCDKTCQGEEWKVHKLLHKELEITKEVLSRLEMEESLKSSVTFHTI